MSPILITSMMTVVLAAVAIGQVTPSVTNYMASKAVDSGISRQSALVQQVIRYKASEGAYPGSVADLVAKGYWKSADNTNGFGGTYSLSVDAANNLVTVTTTIADAAARGKYLSSLRHAFKPVDQGSGVVATTFVMPNKSTSGALLPSVDSIPASSTAPNPATNTFWYDTSSGTSAVLKVSDGATWVASTTTGGAAGSSGSSLPPPSTSNIVSSNAALPTTANNWDVRYVQDTSTNTLRGVVYYNGAWIQMGSGANALMVGTLVSQTLPEGALTESFSYDFRPTMSAVYANTYGSVSIDMSQVTWRAEGVLPSGLTMSASTGVLSGTPVSTTLAPPSGNTIKVVATYKNNDASQTFLVQIGPARLKVRSISSGVGFTCAVTTAGAVQCWGKNDVGQLGDGTTVSKSLPTQVTGLTSNFVTVSAGVTHACAINASGQAFCWGKNTYGQIGDNTTVDKTSPVAVATLTSGVTSISVGYNNTCAIQNGAAKCWGQGNYNGDGTSVNQMQPVQVPGLTSGIVSISAANSTTCAVNSSGSAWCWGAGSSGQIGDGTTAALKTSPSAVSGSGFASISVGLSYACAAMTNGDVRCWGLNSKGQLGDGTTTAKLTPTLVPGMSGATSVDSGAESACARTSTAGMKCWGDNTYGTIGDGTQLSRTSPVDVFGLTSGVSAMSTTKTKLGVVYPHACAMLSDGGAKCWGSNSYNEVSTRTETVVVAPRTIRIQAW